MAIRLRRLKNRRKGRSRPTRGALLFVSAFLFASGVLRLGADVERVFAGQSDAPPETETATATGLTPANGCRPPPEIAVVLDAIEQRETRLKERETRLETRLRALSVAEKRIEAELEKLMDVEARLKKTISLADGAAENDLMRLTAVYENMKPKDAAALFEKMDPEFSAGFLGRMKPEAAAGIFAGLSSERAYAISAILAGRNVGAPTK